MKKRLAVLGGGASGFFAAINIAEQNPDCQIQILEKSNKLLSKVRISGGGRCNVTHACFDDRELIENYPRGQKELLGPFSRFSVPEIISWFEEKGVELKVEDDGRMFPASNSSESIISCFLEASKKLGIDILMNTEVLEISKAEQFLLKLKSGESLQADAVVVAIGGHPQLSHYKLIQSLGHRIYSPIPSLFTFNLKKHPSNALMGLALNAEVRLLGTKLTEYGPVLFTHWGMSGPAILKLSSKAASLLHKKNYQFNYEVCWMEQAEDFVAEARRKQASKKLSHTKVAELPNRFWSYLLERSGVDANKNWADLNRKECDSLIQALQADAYTASGKTTFKEEFVTCGGVDLSEINMQAMESKLLPDLYFCGEVVNVDALTGGFNFQAAWTSAWLVAQSLSKINRKH